MKIKEIRPCIDEDNVKQTIDAVIYGSVRYEDKKVFLQNIKHALSEYFNTYLNYALAGTESWSIDFFEGEKDIDSEKEFLHVLGDLYNIEDEGKTEEEKSLFYVPGVEVYVNDEKRSVKVYLQNLVENFEYYRPKFSLFDLMLNITEKFYSAAYVRYSNLRDRKKKGFDVFDVDLEMYESLLGKEEAEYLYDMESTTLGIDELLEIVNAYELCSPDAREHLPALIEIIENAVEKDEECFDNDVEYKAWIGFPEEVYGYAAARSIFRRVFQDTYSQVKSYQGKEEKNDAVLAGTVGLTLMKKSLDKFEKWIEQDNVDLSQEGYEAGRVACACLKGFDEEFYINYLKELYFTKNTLAPEYTVDLACLAVEGGRPYKKTRSFMNNIIMMVKEANAITTDEKMKTFYGLVSLIHNSYVLKLNNIIGDGENGSESGSEEEKE